MGEDPVAVCEELRDINESDAVSLVVKDFDESENEMTLDAECYKINTHSHMDENGLVDETEIWLLVESPDTKEKRECTVSINDGHTGFRMQEDPYPNQSPLFDETDGDELGYVASASLR